MAQTEIARLESMVVFLMERLEEGKIAPPRSLLEGFTSPPSYIERNRAAAARAPPPKLSLVVNVGNEARPSISSSVQSDALDWTFDSANDVALLSPMSSIYSPGGLGVGLTLDAVAKALLPFVDPSPPLPTTFSPLLERPRIVDPLHAEEHASRFDAAMEEFAIASMNLA